MRRRGGRGVGDEWLKDGGEGEEGWGMSGWSGEGLMSFSVSEPHLRYAPGIPYTRSPYIHEKETMMVFTSSTYNIHAIILLNFQTMILGMMYIEKKGITGYEKHLRCIKNYE